MPITIVLDVILLGLLIYSARNGYVSGAWYQVKHTGVLIAAIWVPVHFGAPLAHLLEGRIGVKYNVLFFCSVAGLWLVTELVGAFAVSMLQSAWLQARKPKEGSLPVDHRKRIRHTSHDPFTKGDRYGGAVIGVLDMAVMLWLALSLFVVIEKDLGFPVSKSALFQFVDRRNAVTLFFAPQADRLERALDRAAEAGRKLKGHDPFAKLRDDPRVKTLLEARQKGGGVLSSSQGLSVLTDPDLESKLKGAIDEANEAEEAHAAAAEAAAKE